MLYGEQHQCEDGRINGGCGCACQEDFNVFGKRMQKR